MSVILDGLSLRLSVLPRILGLFTLLTLVVNAGALGSILGWIDGSALLLNPLRSITTLFRFCGLGHDTNKVAMTA